LCAPIELTCGEFSCTELAECIEPGPVILFIMTWIVLALIAPLFWAFSNLFDKYALDRVSKNIPDFIFFGTMGSFVVVLSLLSFANLGPISNNLLVLAILGGALINYSYIFYAKALEKADASSVVPLFQTIPIFVLVLGFLFFDELISKAQFIGFFVVFVGGLVLTIDRSVLRKFKINKGFWLMLPSSLMIAVSTLLADHVLESVSFITFFTYDLVGFSLAGISLLLYSPWRKTIIKGIKEARPPKYLLYFINDGFDMAGHIFYTFALISAPSAALASVVLGVQPFYVLVLGTLLTLFMPKIIKENISKSEFSQKLLGILIISTGIILISLL